MLKRIKIDNKSRKYGFATLRIKTWQSSKLKFLFQLGTTRIFFLDGLKIICKVKKNLVLPFKLGPHRSELRLGARGRHDVVHDVDMDVVEDDHVPVGDGAAAVVNDVAEDDAVFRRSHLHVGLDAEKHCPVK